MTDAAAHFDSLYRASPDPWNYRTSAYEARKYAATLGALTRPHYGTGIEIGCSIGVLSAQLAARCSRFIAVDFSAQAVTQAAERLLPVRGATAICATIPSGWPRGAYDLIMLSELIYYLPAADIVVTAAMVARDAAPQAECVLVHYQGDTQTDISPNDARALFCNSLSKLRKIAVTDHPTCGDYNHRTILFV